MTNIKKEQLLSPLQTQFPSQVQNKSISRHHHHHHQHQCNLVLNIYLFWNMTLLDTEKIRTEILKVLEILVDINFCHMLASNMPSAGGDDGTFLQLWEVALAVCTKHQYYEYIKKRNKGRGIHCQQVLVQLPQLFSQSCVEGHRQFWWVWNKTTVNEQTSSVWFSARGKTPP